MHKRLCEIGKNTSKSLDKTILKQKNNDRHLCINPIDIV